MGWGGGGLFQPLSKREFSCLPYRQVKELWFIVLKRRCSAEVDKLEISPFDHKMPSVGHLNSTDKSTHGTKRTCKIRHQRIIFVST